MEPFSEEALERAVRTLARRDPVIRALARRVPRPGFRPHEGYFETLVSAVISQQISTAAARSIKARLLAAFDGTFSAPLMVEAPDEVFRSSGISPQKLAYLRSLAVHVVDGRLELDRIAEMEDAEVVAELTAVKGIGVWTAQMFLIFSLARLDILPTGDLGVRKGTQIAYDLEEPPSPRRLEDLAVERRWAPFRSVASWYMWRALQP